MSSFAMYSADPRPESEVRSQLEELRNLISASRAVASDDFASELSLESLVTHEADLLQELRAAEMITSGSDLEVVLDGDPVEDHAVEANFLAAVLAKVQQLTLSIAQAGYAAALDLGTIYRDVLGENRLLVSGVRPSSFAVQFKLGTGRDADDREAAPSPGHAGDEQVTGSSAAPGPTPQDVLEVLTQLLHQEVPSPRLFALLNVPEVKRDYAALLEVIARDGATLRVRTRRRPRGVLVTSRDARNRARFMKTLQSSEVAVSVHGTLVGGSIESKRFELRSGDQFFKGRVTEEAQAMMRRFTWGADVVADLRVRTKAHEEGLGEPNVTYTLTALRRAIPSAG
jgi:hypothetical protein